MRQRVGVSRRVFLKRAAQAATIAAPTILPSCAKGANEKIQIGYIGLGRRLDYTVGLKRLPTDKFALVAFCDVNNARIESTKFFHNKDAAGYTDYRDMLASDSVDAVVIATPDHWHARQTIDACKAGKDVYVEKPVALTIAEGAAMVKAARAHNRIVQVGTQQRSGWVCMQGCQAVLDGVVGKVTEVHCSNYPSSWECDVTEKQPVPKGLNWDLWLGQTPPHTFHEDIYKSSIDASTYSDGRPRGWSSYSAWSGGNMTAWGAHGLDVVQWALDKDGTGPVEAWPDVVEDTSKPCFFIFLELKDNSWKEGHALTCPVHFKYADGTTIHLNNKGPGSGALFVGEKGAILVDRQTIQTKMNGEEMKTVTEPNEDYDGGTTPHYVHWSDCIRSRQLSRSDIAIAHRSTTMCHIANIVRRLGRKVAWDPETETFGNDTEANSYLKREARPPWGVT